MAVTTRGSRGFLNIKPAKMTELTRNIERAVDVAEGIVKFCKNCARAYKEIKHYCRT